MENFRHPKNSCYCPKIGTMRFYNTVMPPKVTSRMANSVHPGQTAPSQSDLGLVFAQTYMYLSENVG